MATRRAASGLRRQAEDQQQRKDGEGGHQAARVALQTSQVRVDPVRPDLNGGGEEQAGQAQRREQGAQQALTPRAGGVVAATAAVVELEPAGVQDMIAFLSAGGIPGDSRWVPVFAHLRVDPAEVLAQALSLPLMAALARAAYTGPASQPAGLLGTSMLTGRAGVEDHLLDAFLPAVYGRRPPPPAAGYPGSAISRYDPEQARRWLTFLACHLPRLPPPSAAGP